MLDLVKGKSRELEPLVSQPGFALTFFEKHLLDCYASILGYQGIFFVTIELASHVSSLELPFKIVPVFCLGDWIIMFNLQLW